jgi:hypothetical protein
MLADNGRRGAEISGCLGEASPFGYADESVEFIQVSERRQRWHFLFTIPGSVARQSA